MKFHYPNGKKYVEATPPSKKAKAKPKQLSYSNRGMTLEEDINETNQYYLHFTKRLFIRNPHRSRLWMFIILQEVPLS